jgi:hypothetical protein
MIRRYSLVLLFLLAACGSTPGVQEFLDPETSVTVSYTDTPLILYQDRSGRAAFARDFVNIGPIQVNRMGRERYYLWLAIWSTNETRYNDSRSNDFELVTIFADGEPMLLDVAGWTPSAVGATRSIYTKPVSSATEAFYEVSIDQIRLLGTAVEIRVQTSGERSTSYEMWDSSESATRGFREFLKSVSF